MMMTGEPPWYALLTHAGDGLPAALACLGWCRVAACLLMEVICGPALCLVAATQQSVPTAA